MYAIYILTPYSKRLVRDGFLTFDEADAYAMRLYVTVEWCIGRYETDARAYEYTV